MVRAKLFIRLRELILQRVNLLKMGSIGADCKVAGNPPVCNAGHHAAVIEVYDCAVIAHISVFQKQVGEIRTPFFVDFPRREVLLQLVFKYFVRFPGLCAWLFGAADGVQTQFPVHIFMDSCAAVAVSSAFQISCHAAVTVHAVMAVVDIPDLLLNLCFLGMIIRLPVFPVVVISIRADSQPLQQPADAVFLMVLVNEPIKP